METIQLIAWFSGLLAFWLVLKGEEASIVFLASTVIAIMVFAVMKIMIPAGLEVNSDFVAIYFISTAANMVSRLLRTE